ncbi:hypothetical protein Tco_0951044 [Tanacetum coccineum]|uniref:Uncharacterized protein n=1 Tax=Tanacetum coccineum TaxID=301880 RepID=A0ABQ5DYZ7_9ASTR
MFREAKRQWVSPFTRYSKLPAEIGRIECLKELDIQDAGIYHLHHNNLQLKDDSADIIPPAFSTSEPCVGILCHNERRAKSPCGFSYDILVGKNIGMLLKEECGFLNKLQHYAYNHIEENTFAYNCLEEEADGYNLHDLNDSMISMLSRYKDLADFNFFNRFHDDFDDKDFL